MLLFPLFLLIIPLSLINARSTNISNTSKISRRSTPKVYDVELVLRQAQNDNDFDDPPPTRSSVVYPSSAAIIPEDEGDGIDPLGSLVDDEDDVIDGEDKEIKRMPSRFYRRRFGNRYVRPFVGGIGMPTMGGGMPTMGGSGMAPFGYGMRRPGGMALGGMNINGMGGMNGNMGSMGSGMTGSSGGMGMPMSGGGMGSGMMNGNGNDGMNGGGGGMGPDGSDGSDDIAYPSRFNYRRPFPMIPNPDGMRGNGINGYGTSYGPNNNLGNNGNWFNNNNNNNYGDGFNGGVGYGYQFRGGMMGGGGNGMGPSPGGYGPSGSSSSCGPMGCGNGGGGGNNGMMGSNMGQGMMRPGGGGGGPGGFYMGGFPGGPSMIGRGGMGMGMGMNGGWNGPMGANMGGGGGDDGDGGMGGDGMMGGGGMNGDGPPTGAVGIHMSNNGYSYAAYIERQVRSTTIMMYTLVGCAPCQRAKHMLAVHYADVKSHFLELVGDEDWQRQLQVDLQHVTGAMTFPYIFVCGNYIGGSTDLIALHQSGQLRRMVNSCSRKVVAKAAVAAVAASV